MRVELKLEEIQTAIEDYLVKQGIERSKITGILFQNRDGSLNYDVEKIELSIHTN